MPKGSKSVGALCAELGMDSVAETNFRKESQSYLKEQIPDVPNASDELVERIALKYLHAGAGNKHFSWDAALNYQWEASEHRLTIVQYVGDIMKQQRWYMIDRLHKRVNGAIHCPGCLLHSPKASPQLGDDVEAGAQVDDTVLSGSEDGDSIHHSSTKDRNAEIRKRPRGSLDNLTPSGTKRRKSASDASDGTVEVAKRESQPQTSAYNTMPPDIRTSGFTPVNPTVVVEIPRPTTRETPAAAQTPGQTHLTLKDFSLTMRYRNKVWHFNSIAHKAKVLEQIILQEEKDIESYPVLAFSKGAKKAAFGGEVDSDSDESALKDYFRFYTHFMNERFPSNEKTLLENGVTPSAV